MNFAPTRTLVIVNALALVGLAFLWVDQKGQLRNLAWTAPAPVKAVVGAVPPPNLSAGSMAPAALAATLERPLFAPDRRPPPPVLPPPPPPPPDPLANVQLLGLFSGDISGVLIKSEGKVRRVNLSQKLGQWTLQDIKDRSVTFTRDNETRVIRLEYSRLNAPIQPKATPVPPVAGGTGVASSTPPTVDTARRAEELEKERIRAEISARSTQKKP